MKPWDWTITALALVAALFLACQTGSDAASQEESVTVTAMPPPFEASVPDEEPMTVEASVPDEAPMTVEASMPDEASAPLEEPPPVEEPALVDEPMAAEEPALQEEAPQEKQPKAKAPAAKKPEEKPTPATPPEKKKAPVAMGELVFEANAFPPTVSDVEYHKDAWLKDDCMRCHETGVEKAPRTMHKDMPAILLTAKCRSCHVVIPGQKPIEKKPAQDSEFESYAFPPMIPASTSHQEAWLDDNCLLCHEGGVRGAPKVKHAGMPALLLKAKCRSCHVQVRSATIKGR